MSLVAALAFFSTGSSIIPVIAALFNYKHLDKIMKIVAAFFLVSALSDLTLGLMAYRNVYNNYPVIHVFILLSVLFFGAIYYYAFFNPALKNAILILAIVVALFCIINSIFIEGIWGYPSISNTVVGIFLIIISLAYFHQLLSRQEFVHIEKQGLFWINAGVLFYYSLNIFLFMLFTRIERAHLGDFYMIHNIVNIFANLLYSAGLLCKPQKTT